MDTPDPLSNRYDFTFPLGEIVGPGQQIVVNNHFIANLPVGVYDIYVTTVKRGICFFGEQGCWGSFAGVWNDASNFTLTVNESTPGTIPTNGLTNYFSFDGTANDSVGGINGTLNGNASFSTGVQGEAISFDGNSDYVALSDLLIGGSSSWSMCGFAKINDNTRRHSFYGEYSNISNGETDNYIVHLGQDNANLGVSYDTFPPSGGATTSKILDIGSWSSFCVIRDQATVSIYLDGQLEGQAPYDQYAGSLASIATFGARMKSEGVVYDSPADTTKYSMNGLLDEVRVYDRALNESEILSLSIPGGFDDAIGISFYKGQVSPAQIHMSDLDGDNLRKVSVGSSAETIHSWSPDGRKLLFTRIDEIYMADADESGNLSNITNLTADPANDHSAAWTPDGNGIIFASNRHGNFELYSMDLNGGSIERLTFTAEGERNPAIAPDGSIAATQDDNKLVIFTESNGVYSENLVYSAGTVVTPNWTSDSQKIIFSAGSNYAGAVNNDLAIYSIDRTGLSLEQIVPGFANSPSLSADGENIVYMANRNGAPAPLNIFNLSSGITRSLGQIGNLPQWRPALPPNSPPTITGTATIEQYEGLEILELYSFNDLEGDDISVETSGLLPEGVEIFPYLGPGDLLSIEGIPESGEAGSYAILISATDDTGNVSSEEVTITINSFPELAIFQEEGPVEIQGKEGEQVAELTTSTFRLFDPLGVVSPITTVPILSGLPINASLEFVSYVTDDYGIFYEYKLSWFPTYDQGNQTYSATISATNFSGVTTNLPVQIFIQDTPTVEVISELQSDLYSIDLDVFKGFRNSTERAHRKKIENHITQMNKYLGNNRLDKALDEVLKAVKSVDDDFLELESNNDVIDAGIEQESLLNSLLEVAKTLTQSMREQGYASPPLILVHGLGSDSSTWSEFILQSGLSYSGNVQVSFDQDTSEISVTTAYEAELSSVNSFSIYTVELSDGDDVWDDIELESQGMMLQMALEGLPDQNGDPVIGILDHSGASEAVLLGHSMGGLSIKSYLRYYSGSTENVKGYMTIGTPHRGINYNDLCLLADNPIVGFIVPSSEELCALQSSPAAMDMQFGGDPIFEISESISYNVDFRFALGTQSAFGSILQDPDLIEDYFSGLFGECVYSDQLYPAGVSIDDDGTRKMYTDFIVPLFSQLNQWCDSAVFSESEIHAFIGEDIRHDRQTESSLVINRLMFEYWSKAIP